MILRQIIFPREGIMIFIEISISRWKIEVVFSRNSTESHNKNASFNDCLLYTSDAADDMQCVDLGGRRIIKK